jgi:hypothetical protein
MSETGTDSAGESGDVTPVRRLAMRDAAIALGALSLWAAADAWRVATGLTAASVLTALNGLGVGYALVRMAHEWGHFAGARWAGGIAPTRSIEQVFFFFDFDLQRSPPEAFRAMGIGGNLAHWSMVVLLLTLAPLDAPSRAALPAAALGFAVMASLIEIPVIRRAYAGVAATESFQGITRETLRRDRGIGLAAGVLVFLVAAA